MKKLLPVSLRLDEDVVLAMEALKAHDGIPMTEQMRRALRLWLKWKRGEVSIADTTLRGLSSRVPQPPDK